MLKSTGSSDLFFLKTHGYQFGEEAIKFGLSKAQRGGETLACKIVTLRKKTQKKFKIDAERFEILKNLSGSYHPHVISIHSIVHHGDLTFIFKPWLDEGNLLDHIRKNGMIAELQAKKWFHQIVCGVSHIHSMNYAHFNLSLESIMMSKTSVKISGLHKIVSGTRNPEKVKKVSAAYCLSPEVISDQEQIDAKKVDIYALGIILFVMLNDKFPFIYSDKKKLLEDQNNRRYTLRTSNIEKLSINCQVMIHALLEPISDERWNIKKVSDLKWLKQFKGDQAGDF